MNGEILLGSEELETLLHVLGEHAAMPARLSAVTRVDAAAAAAVRTASAHALLARGLLTAEGSGHRADPELAAALAVAARQCVAVELDLERDGTVTTAAACTDGVDALLAAPRGDGTVLLRWFPRDRLPAELVLLAGPLGPATGPGMVLPARVLAEPFTDADRSALTGVLTGRGLDPGRAAVLAALLRGRTGSGRATVLTPAGGDRWHPVDPPVAWWDTGAGRHLVEPAGTAPEDAGMVRIRPCTAAALQTALAAVLGT